MKVIDKFADEGLFAAINELNEYPFMGGNPQLFDDIFIINYGQRYIFDPYESLSVDRIAQIVNMKLSEQWDRISAMYGLLDDVGVVEDTTSDKSTTENTTDNRDTVNTVSAFDSDALVDNDGNTVSGNNISTGDDNTVGNRKTVDGFAKYNLLQQNERASIMNGVMQSVAIELTLSIY